MNHRAAHSEISKSKDTHLHVVSCEELGPQLLKIDK